MNKELTIVLHNLAVGYSKKGVHLSQVHQQSNETQRLVQLRQLHPLQQHLLRYTIVWRLID